ncbi:MAG: hypothetical protein ACOCVP_02690 [Wenzhouxiangella sp.]
MKGRTDVLVTGVPRGGTTLVGALLDSLPDTVCLSEPAWQWHKATGGKLDIGPDPRGEVFAKWLVGDVVDLRRRLLAGEEILDRRSVDNRSPTNYHGASDDAGQTGCSGVQVRRFSPGRLEPDFTLAIKHNGPYLTALGPLLNLDYFTIIGVVRHPIDVIHSWRSLDLPVSRGKMHDAARCWPEMAQATAAGDLLKRQVLIYDLICQRLYACREQLTLLRYEDVLADPACVPRAIGVDTPPAPGLVGKPTRTVSEQQRRVIADALLRYGHHYRRFYPDAGQAS